MTTPICDICDSVICKYEIDVNSTGTMYYKDKLICEDCQKEIAHWVVDKK